MLNAFLALKVWGAKATHKIVTLVCDNQSTVAVINSGRTRDLQMQKLAREMWLLSAIHKFKLTAKHQPGEFLFHADLLSRLHLYTRIPSDIQRVINSLKFVFVDEYQLKTCTTL